MGTMSLELEISTFAGRVGEKFSVQAEPDRTLELELTEVKSLRSDAGTSEPDSERREPFSILFRGPRDPALPQKIYPFEHPDLGPFDLFIVPIGPDKSGMLYEAIFN
jgi:hypothetical protein